MDFLGAPARKGGSGLVPRDRTRRMPLGSLSGLRPPAPWRDAPGQEHARPPRGIPEPERRVTSSSAAWKS